MLKDIPYSKLTQDGRAYEIMLLRDQYGNTFTDLAKEYKISVSRVGQLYNRILHKKIHLYINHISVVLGHKNDGQLRKVYNDAYDCYQDWVYACAYLEKKYKDILIEYRGGEPGLPTQFINNLPPFKLKLSKKTIARVIEMRDVQKASFVTIAKELQMTQEKERITYHSFYHKKVMDIIKKAESEEEKNALRKVYFRGNKTPKHRYDMITKDNLFYEQHSLRAARSNAVHKKY